VKETYIYYPIKRKLKISFILILMAISSFINVFPQKSQGVPTRQSSLESFAKGNYEQAYNDFSQLLLKYPKDPLYKYYCGVCLVMMKRDTEKAVTLLQESVNGAAVVKSLPPDGLFYLGRAQQMSGKFTEAIESYTLYAGQVGKKISKEQKVQDYIQECENRKGMVAAASATSATGSIGVKAIASQQEDQPGVSETLNKPVEDVIPGREELPADYELVLDEALKLQYKADSLTTLAEEQKSGLDKLPESERSSMKMKISQNEMLGAYYQKSADSKYNEAQDMMNPGKEKTDQKQDSVPVAVTKEPVRMDENIAISEITGNQDTIKKEAPVISKPAGTCSIFEILPAGAAYPDEKIKIDPDVPAGLIYRIQIAVFRNPIAPSYFKGITPVYGFKVTGSDKTNYYAGMFRRSADAKKALQAVKETGFRDAFVAAFSDKKSVSADRAAVLENEWGMKPLYDVSMPGAVIDTIPPELVFRVEAVRALKPLKVDAIESLRTMAGSRGLDILHLTDGNIVYLIGKFITFESAAEYADLLIRNNYRGAKVVAWLGNKEVSVETAKQLFNDLE
jgi:hypothetical protein